MVTFTVYMRVHPLSSPLSTPSLLSLPGLGVFALGTLLLSTSTFSLGSLTLRDSDLGVEVVGLNPSTSCPRCSSPPLSMTRMARLVTCGWMVSRKLLYPELLLQANLASCVKPWWSLTTTLLDSGVERAALTILMIAITSCKMMAKQEAHSKHSASSSKLSM